MAEIEGITPLEYMVLAEKYGLSPEHIDMFSVDYVNLLRTFLRINGDYSD